MAFTRYASFDHAEILDIKGSQTRRSEISLDKVSHFEDYRTSDGFMYVRIRAISSRCNKNHDGWPTAELAGSQEIVKRHQSSSGFTVEAADGNKQWGFASFVGKPIFVDHNNGDPKKARGVIVDSKFRILDAKTAGLDPYWSSHDVDPEHLPASEVELLLEIDAKSFPKLAADILDGDLDGFSMGADVERTKCSHCNNIATVPDEFCSHVLMKGAHHDYKTADGKRVSRKSYENCYGVRFFEISAVFDPADETALLRDITAKNKQADIVPGQPPGPGAIPDPARQHDTDIADLAMAYQMQHGMDANTAMQMAQQYIEKKRGRPPGHGEGFSVEGYPRPDQYAKLPPEVDVANATATAPGNDPRWSSVHTAEEPLPQSMLVHAPDEVDTLRNEQLCPICGNEMNSESCDVCGYTSPPKEFQNPDLSQAERIRGEMKKQEEQAAQPGGGGSGEQPQGQGPLTSQPTKPQPTASVTNEMSWKPLVTPKTAARINKVEQPVQAPTTVVTNEPTTQTVVSDQTRPVTSAMLTAQRLMATAQRNHTGEESMSTHTADATSPGDTAPKTRVDVTGVGGVDEASNEAASKADGQVDVNATGGTGVEGVAPDHTENLPTASEKSDDSGFNKDKTTEDSGPTKTFGDSDGTEKGVTDPVTSDPFPASEDGVKAAASYYQRIASAVGQENYEQIVTEAAGHYAAAKKAYDDKTLEQNEQQGNKPVAEGGSAVQGVQPADPVATDSYKRENLLEHHTTPANNSGETKTWSGTEGNGVLRQQEPVTKNLQEWGGVPVPNVELHTSKAHFLSAIRLAEAEVELGLTDHEAKFNRIAELDAQSPAEVGAQLDALARVKTAGLAKLAQQRQSGVRRLPTAFGKATAAPDGFERIASEAPAQPEPVSDELLDSALFSR